MIDRSKYFPICTMFFGLFILSVGCNIILLDKVNELTSIINTANSPLSKSDFEKIIEETKRLSKQTYTNDTNDSGIQYDIKTKKPIKNNF